MDLDFTKEERRMLQRLNTPDKIQEFINNNLQYDFEENGETFSPFRDVIRKRKAHCLEGALFACGTLYYHGYPPRIVCMEARDIDHNIAIYRINGCWGSVAQSRDENLKGREARFRSIKDLVMSYYPYYWDFFSKDQDKTNLTMRGYATINLNTVDISWIFSEKGVVRVVNLLWGAKYRFLFPNGSKFYKVDKKTNKLIFL